MKIHLRAIIFFLMLIIPVGRGWSAEKFVIPTSLERAEELLTANEPAEALSALSSYEPSHEEMSVYHYAIARALGALNKHYDSIEHYRLAYVYADAPADKQRILLEQADVYTAMGYYPESAVCYRLFLKQFPKSSFSERAELGVAEAQFENGEYLQSLAHYERAGTSVRTVMGKANTLQALGRTAEAHDLYRTLIENDPKVVSSSPETLYSIGENYRQMNNQKDARLYYDSVKDPVLKYRAALGLGLIDMGEANYIAAVMQFSVAAESPDRTVQRDAIMNRADAQMRMGKDDEALAELEEIKNKYPYGKQADAAALLLAELYRKKGKAAESIDLLKPLIYRLNPVSAALDELEIMILEAKDRNPKEFVTLWKMSGRWLLDQSREKSIIKIAQALRNEGKPFLEICTWLIKYGSDEGKAEGRFLLAGFYADMGDATTAETYLKRARIRGHRDEVERLRAKIYLEARDARSASIALMSIRDIQEADLIILLDTMRLLKDNKKATAFFERTLRKRRFSAEIVMRFADVLYDWGQREKALDYYLEATTVKPEQGRQDDTSGDADWAHYRIAVIAKGSDGTDSLKAIQSAKNAVGRLAAAELKGTELLGKVE